MPEAQVQNCQRPGCSSVATTVVIDMRQTRPPVTDRLCDEHCSEFLDHYAQSIGVDDQSSARPAVAAQFKVEVLINKLDTDPHDLYLREVSGKRRVLLQPYYCEAWAIAWLLQEIRPARPLTHRIFVDAVSALGARVDHVLIEDVVDGLIHARLKIVDTSGTVEIDARASDAIAIALAANSPIFVAEHVVVASQPSEVA